MIFYCIVLYCIVLYDTNVCFFDIDFFLYTQCCWTLFSFYLVPYAMTNFDNIISLNSKPLMVLSIEWHYTILHDITWSILFLLYQFVLNTIWYYITVFQFLLISTQYWMTIYAYFFVRYPVLIILHWSDIRIFYMILNSFISYHIVSYS